MTHAGARALEEQIGATLPPGLKTLSDGQLGDLAGAVHEARRRQAAELAAAGDKAMELVPRLMRGPVRRILG